MTTALRGLMGGNATLAEVGLALIAPVALTADPGAGGALALRQKRALTLSAGSYAVNLPLARSLPAMTRPRRPRHSRALSA